MAACYKCGKPIITSGSVELDAVCPECSSYLHCCANCTHYDEYSSQLCLEPRADYVFDRLGRNACSFFKLKSEIRQPERQQRSFAKGEPRDKASRARDNLSRLFRS